MDSSNKREEFTGKLEGISPKTLLGEKEHAFEDFFLVLALVYNDLKGLLLFGVLLSEVYRQPELEELSPHAGEIYGLRTQQEKLIASHIREFLKFLMKRRSLLGTPKFRLFINQLNPEMQKLWGAIQGTALRDEISDHSSFAYSLRRIRDNVGYHYDDAHKSLREGFESFFSQTPKNKGSEKALYALGNSMTETRFYFIDAAVRQYISLRAANVKMEGREMSTLEHATELTKTVSDMNQAIYALMKIYLSQKKARP